MLVTVLGSGTAMPVPDRFPAGYWVTAGKTSALVDCGPGTLRRFAQAGGDIATLDAVLLTHYHTDHCADLAALLFALHAPQFAGRPPLRIYGAPGLVRLVQTLRQIWPWLEPRGYELELCELAPGGFTVGELAVTAIPIRHTAQSLGYRIATPAGVAAFSGDTDECDALVELARDADLFVCDCSAPDDAKIDGHLTPGLAADHARRAAAKTLVLTHFYPVCDGRDLAGMAARRYQGRIVLAEDLARLTPGPTTGG
ncbi:MAG: ribonuclease Z [Planctomycetes bacterium]|nr:ribonuclease Z [Planctomycetota bacterium]